MRLFLVLAISERSLENLKASTLSIFRKKVTQHLKPKPCVFAILTLILYADPLIHILASKYKYNFYFIFSCVLLLMNNNQCMTNKYLSIFTNICDSAVFDGLIVFEQPLSMASLLVLKLQTHQVDGSSPVGHHSFNFDQLFLCNECILHSCVCTVQCACQVYLTNMNKETIIINQYIELCRRFLFLLTVCLTATCTVYTSSLSASPMLFVQKDFELKSTFPTFALKSWRLHIKRFSL